VKPPAPSRQTLRCPWCKGRYTVPAHGQPGARMLLCPYCGSAADAREGSGWQARAAEAVAVRAARLSVRLRRRLWALGAGDVVRPS